MASSARVTTITLAGVPVDVSGPAVPGPAVPPPNTPEGAVWPTIQMALYTSVLMDNGERWMVTRLRRTPSGGVAITLTSPQNAGTEYSVPRMGLETPMWLVGELPLDSTPTEEEGGEHTNEPLPPIIEIPEVVTPEGVDTSPDQ